jgi:hypothetical protein
MELSHLVCHLKLLTPNRDDATMDKALETPDIGHQVSMVYGTLVADRDDRSNWGDGDLLLFP